MPTINMVHFKFRYTFDTNHIFIEMPYMYSYRKVCNFFSKRATSRHCPGVVMTLKDTVTG